MLSGKLADGLTPEYRVVGLQLAVTLALAGGWALAGGSWRSLLLGGVAAIVPNAWFAWRIGRAQRDQLPERQVRAVLWGAAEKLLLMAGLVAFVLLRIEDIAALTFFVGFTVALATHHVASAITAGGDREA